MSGSNDNSSKNPTIALLLSGVGLFIPIMSGAGQIYNNEVGKGIAFSLIQCIQIVVVFFFFWTIIPIITYTLAGGYFAYDAYNTA